MVTTALEFGLERLYKASSKEVDFVEVPALNFVMLDGTGDPNTSQAYKAALEVLYAISYGLKFALKREQELEYHVHPLEGLWWADDMAEFSVERKVNWKWTMMIAQPDAVTTDRLPPSATTSLARSRSQPYRRLGWKSSMKGIARRSCTLVPTARKGRPLRACMRSSVSTAIGLTAGGRSTMRSIWAIRVAWPQRSGGPSFASQWLSRAVTRGRPERRTLPFH